jgi:hypothetical protein
MGIWNWTSCAGKPRTISAGWAPHRACREPIPRMSASTPHPVAPNLFLTRSSHLDQHYRQREGRLHDQFVVDVIQGGAVHLDQHYRQGEGVGRLQGAQAEHRMPRENSAFPPYLFTGSVFCLGMPINHRRYVVIAACRNRRVDQSGRQLKRGSGIGKHGGDIAM